MARPRIIPCLLLDQTDLVKTVRFRDPKYIGDPVNAVKIFNEKEVDELVLLDISATRESRQPNLQLVEEIASEAFMPVGYGGGIRHLDDARRVFGAGIEKVVVNTQAWENRAFITELAKFAGSQSVVASIDVKKTFFGKYSVFTRSGRLNTGVDPVSYAQAMEKAGAGELFLTSIDRDGTMQGLDLDLITRVARAVDCPVIACGGAGSLIDLRDCIRKTGVSAVAAGSLFVYQGPNKAVLITYPNSQELDSILR